MFFVTMEITGGHITNYWEGEGGGEGEEKGEEEGEEGERGGLLHCQHKTKSRCWKF